MGPRQPGSWRHEEVDIIIQSLVIWWLIAPPYSPTPRAFAQMVALVNLLRCTLHPLGSMGNAVFFIFVHACGSLSSSLAALINVLQVEIIDHGICWWWGKFFSWRQDLLELG